MLDTQWSSVLSRACFAVWLSAWLAGIAAAQAVRISHDVGGVASRGSGALVAHDESASYYITCGHLFDDGRGRTSILIPNSATVPAEIHALDRAHDLALLRSPRVEGDVLDYDPAGSIDGDLTAYGFGPTGRFRGVRGPLVGYATPHGARHASLRMRGAVRSGDSGGPVVDVDRELVAVIWGQRDDETYATFGPPLEAMMARLAQCRGGVCRPRGGSRGVAVVPSPSGIAPVDRKPKPDPWLAYRERNDARLDRIEAALAGLNELPEQVDSLSNRLDGLPIDRGLSPGTLAKINAIAVKVNRIDTTEVEARLAVGDRLVRRR